MYFLLGTQKLRVPNTARVSMPVFRWSDLTQGERRGSDNIGLILWLSPPPFRNVGRAKSRRERQGLRGTHSVGFPESFENTPASIPHYAARLPTDDRTDALIRQQPEAPTNAVARPIALPIEASIFDRFCLVPISVPILFQT
jgi:hypothetical protein